MIKLIIKFLATLSIFMSTISCSKNEKKENISNSENLNISTTKMKIEIFNDVHRTIETLSKNGIGELKNWRGDELGYFSITDYFEFGVKSSKMPNNIAYYLESHDKNYIKSTKIVLNINNNSESKIAIAKLKEITELTYYSLSLEIPNGLIDSILEQKKYSFENDTFSTKLTSEESKIVTWKLIIESK